MAAERGASDGRRAILVYYKVAVDDAPALLQAFSRLIAPSDSWRVELMRRAGTLDTDPNVQTWMEVYRLDDGDRRDLDELGQLIEARARHCGIRELVTGPRHYEAFETCA